MTENYFILFFFESVQKILCFRKKIIFCFQNFWNCFHIYIFENRFKSVIWINENHFVSICLFTHNFTNKYFKKKFQIRFVFSSVNFFDFFNTFVFSFSIFSISTHSVSSNHFSLKNFLRSSNIEKKRTKNAYRNPFNAQNEEFELNETATAELSIKSKFYWKFKTLMKIDSTVEKESDSSRNSNKFDHTNHHSQSKNSNEVELNLNFIKFKIQKLKNSQSLFSFSKHHFSFNTSQLFSKTSMNSDENEQNEIDEHESSFDSNLFQQNIQGIALSMFNLFKNNIVFRHDANASNNSFDNEDWKTFFQTQNVEFFDSTLNESYDSGDVVQIKKNVYYKNVYLFVERIKNAVNMYTTEKVRFNLFSCLKKTVQIWYTENLSDFEKKALRSLNIEIEKWCDVLIKKFKQSIFSALQFFSSKSYFFDDLKNKKNMSNFVFSVIKHAKTINIADVHDQLIWIYNVIVFELARNIDFSKKIIFVSIFFKQLDNKRKIWFRIYFRKFNKNSFEYGYQSFFKYQNFNLYFKYDWKDDKETYKSNQN